MNKNLQGCLCGGEKGRLGCCYVIEVEELEHLGHEPARSAFGRDVLYTCHRAGKDAMG